MTRIRIERAPGDEGGIRIVETESLAPWDAQAALHVVGRPHGRIEGPDKVTGRAQYACDVRLPGQLHARVLRSPHPHARIRRIDTSRAAALPGVRAVLSSADAPDIEWYEVSRLFDRTVRFVGDEVASVAADTEEAAEDALRLIEVEYEALPFAATLEDALRPDAPGVHPSGNRVGEPERYERGDPDAAFREAEVVIERTYTTSTALHNCMEPHGCTAAWEGDRLTLWESTQSVFDVRGQVAEKLGLRESQVRVVMHHMGGGFGSKQIAWKHAVIAALLSRSTGRPVQLMLDREAENLAVGNRNPTRQHVRLGARRDGTLLAVEVRVELAIGAYETPGEGSEVGAIYQRLYRCDNVRTEQLSVYTNAGPSVAFRAPGQVEGAFALESAMDELAAELRMDPLELRLHNYTERDQKDDLPYSSPDALRGCYERVAEAFGWRGYRRPAPDGPRRRGVGIAAHDWGGSGYPPGYAWVKLNSDGSAEVVTGTQDIGSGTRTGLTQVAAEELGLPVDRVALHLGDTATGPYSPVSSGSVTQATIGPAVRAAAADARSQLLRIAAAMLESPADTLRVRDGVISVEGAPSRTIELAEVTRRIAPHMIQGRGARGPNPEDRSVRTFGAQIVEVEVDVETGEVTLLRVVASHDCGRIVNPTLVDSQVIGGVTQGIGFALSEERVVDGRIGVVLNANLEEYKVPTVADVPPIEHARLDLPDPVANPTGAKGIGEPPLIPTAPAIANAIRDAVGVRVRESPLARRRIVDALSGAGAPAGEDA